MKSETITQDLRSKPKNGCDNIQNLRRAERQAKTEVFTPRKRREDLHTESNGGINKQIRQKKEIFEFDFAVSKRLRAEKLKDKKR